MNAGRFDSSVIRRHLLALDRAVVRLRTHAGKQRCQVERDEDDLWAVERGLHLCAQNVLDIATHIAASSGVDVPDYTSALDQLARLAILPEPFAKRFRGVAGFRNVLVHGYLDVDVELIHKILNERLSDFDEFARFVETWLGENECL